MAYWAIILFFLTEDIEIVILTISDHVGVHKAPGGSLRL